MLSHKVEEEKDVCPRYLKWRKMSSLRKLSLLIEVAEEKGVKNFLHNMRREEKLLRKVLIDIKKGS